MNIYRAPDTGNWLDRVPKEKNHLYLVSTLHSKNEWWFAHWNGKHFVCDAAELCLDSIEAIIPLEIHMDPRKFKE